MKNKIGWYAAGVLALAMVAHASIVVYNATLVNSPALAYNSTYPVNLASNGIGALSAQAVYSSATVLNATFPDGSRSTGTATIVSFAPLTAASAVDHVTVASTSNLAGATIAVPGYVFYNGIDWATGSTTHNTAVSIGAALATVPYLSVSVSGSVVYATATVGALYNQYSMLSNNGNLTVATPLFTGGRNNAVFAINGVRLTQGFQWTAATSNNATASSLASAINSSSLGSTLHAAASGAVVTASSTLNGSVFNYPIFSSTPTALSISGGNMTGGSDAGFALGSTAFSATNGSGLTLALPVLYTGTPAIGGLTTGTTYYAVPAANGNFELSDSSDDALAGTGFVAVTSTNTQFTAHTYTLAPLAISGTPSFKWEVSNDNVNWNNLAVSSVTVSSYAGQPFSTLWSFGYIGTQYLRLNVVAPTTGGLALKVSLIGTN